jgi:hypothetical protein
MCPSSSQIVEALARLLGREDVLELLEPTGEPWQK